MQSLQYNGRGIAVASAVLTQARRSLTAWYRRRARELPWRATRDPYAIWVSEIMLQQTQVASVIAYYERFLAAFPTVEALAAAPEESVLRLWEGLGYYRRARHLHQAAQAVVTRHGGRLPREAELLRALPGIGRYTAGAILSIAFERREPILEANSRRVLARLFALEGDPTKQPLENVLWGLARVLLPRHKPGEFNQALMELGSEVCVPGRPDCGGCPLRRCCRARQQGLEDALPSGAAKARIEQVREAAIVVRQGGRILVVRQPPAARWAGMFDFPRVTLGNQKGKALLRFLVAQVQQLARVSIDLPRKIGQIRHGVTRFRISLECYEAWVCGGDGSSGPTQARGRARGKSVAGARDGVHWVTARQLSKLPMPVPGRRLSELVL